LRLPAERRLAVIAEIAQAAGIAGMVGGQVLDVLGDKTAADETTVYETHRRKTAALIMASVKSGGLISNASEERIQALAEYGLHAGMAFQIADDILNVEGSRDLLGKETGSDAQRGKTTYPALLGMEKAKEKLADHIAAARASLQGFDERALPLRVIAQYIMDRQS